MSADLEPPGVLPTVQLPCMINKYGGKVPAAVKSENFYSITVLIHGFILLDTVRWCFKSRVVDKGGKMIKTGSFSTYLWSS